MILIEKTINSVIHRISMEGNAVGYNWTYNWKSLVISFDTPQYRIQTVHGGASRLSFGGASYSPDLFSADWPPQVSCLTTAKYTATNDSAPETFFIGTGHLTHITQTEISYDFYDSAYDIDILAEVTDYDGNTVPLPRALGAVVHANPVRVADVGGKPTYHNGYVAGTKAVDWHVYDDGVNVDANVTDLGNGHFTLSAVPVGEVTLSGTGVYETLADVVTWACGASYLNVTPDTTKWESGIPDFSYWVDNQRNILDFLSDVCAWFGHIFYIKAGTGYLVGMNTDNGARTITEFEFFPSTYEYEPPVNILRSTWVESIAGEFQDGSGGTAGRYVKRTDKDTYQQSAYPYGSEETLRPFCSNKTDIDTCLAAILVLIHKPRCRLKLPLQGSLPVPGEKISWTDTMLGQSTDMYIRARSIAYDFNNEEVTIEGEGALTAT